jgi:hypothetical protein
MGNMYKIHMEHHYSSFPPKSFYGKEGTVKRIYGFEVPTLFQLMDPRRSTNFTWEHEGLLYFFLGIATVILKYGINLSWTSIMFFIILAVLIGTIGSALHSSFHVKGFELEKYQWYQELRTIHYIHHLGTARQNYGIVNIEIVDAIFGNSMKLKDPSPEKSEKKEEILLPEGITKNDILLIKSSSGSISRFVLLNDEAGENEELYKFPTIFTRIILIIFGVWLWSEGYNHYILPFMNIKLFEGVEINDIGHVITGPINRYLQQNSSTSNVLIAIQFLFSDLIAIIIIIFSVFGKSLAPSLASLFFIITRIIFQALTPFIAIPMNKIKFDYIFPSLFGNSNTR